MSIAEFVESETRKARAVMKMVWDTLENNELCGKMDTNKSLQEGQQLQSRLHTFPQRRYCAVTASHCLEVFVEGKNAWKRLFLIDNCDVQGGLTFFTVDQEVYAAIGRKRGIAIYNVREQEEIEVNMLLDDTKGSAFECLSVIGEAGMLNQHLFAAHSRRGVVEIHLDSLVGVQSREIQEKDIFYSAVGKDHVKLAVAGNSVFVSEDRVVSEFLLSRELVEKKQYDEAVYALAVECVQDSEKKVYAGTQGGNILCNGEMFFSTGNTLSTIAKMHLGNYHNQEGVFYITYTKGTYSPLYFTEGSTTEVVSRGGVFESVRDFAIDQQGRFLLLSDDRDVSRGRVEMQGGENKSSIAFNGKGKKIALYGGN